MNKYTRKDISKLFNIGKETLRYYEEIKLMPVAIRDENGYRVYFDEDLLRLELDLCQYSRQKKSKFLCYIPC